MKRIVSLLLTMAVLLGCGIATATQSEAEPTTFTIYYRGSGTVDDLDQIALYQRLSEKYNVKLDFINLGYTYEESREKLNLLYTSGQYKEADAIWAGSSILENEFATLADAGIIVPITEYVTDRNVMPNSAS